jgi:hypothetical protein
MRVFSLRRVSTLKAFEHKARSRASALRGTVQRRSLLRQRRAAPGVLAGTFISIPHVTLVVVFHRILVQELPELFLKGEPQIAADGAQVVVQVGANAGVLQVNLALFRGSADTVVWE